MIQRKLGATHIPSLKGRIFLAWRRPVDSLLGSVFVFPPFAEEMNKTRSLLADLASHMAARGWATVIPDLYGTGDSEGDFADADWTTWIADARAAIEWTGEHIAPPSAFLAVRLGAALCVSAVESGQIPGVRKSVLWQPVLDPARFLMQFLRLRTAATLAQNGKRESADEIRRELQSGQSVEVSGYRLGPQLARDLIGLPAVERLPVSLGSVTWLDLQREADAPINANSKRVVDVSMGHGTEVKYQPVTAAPFWSSTEISRIPEMRAATVAALT